MFTIFADVEFEDKPGALDVVEECVNKLEQVSELETIAVSNTSLLGIEIYTNHLISFEITAFILLVAIQLIIGGLADLEILKINENFLKYF